MEKIQFIFWETFKGLVLVLVALAATKAAKGLPSLESTKGWRASVLRRLLLAVILVLAVAGAWSVGNDTAAEIYYWASIQDQVHGQAPKAYSNALRAVEVRPAEPRYWQQLERSKLLLRQYESALQDAHALRLLSGGRLGEEDAMRFAACDFYLGRYNEVLAITQRLIHQHRVYPLPYLLQGATYTALRNYAQAEETFLAVLQMFPTLAEAVEGLAHAYFLSGATARAVAVLNETQKYAFPAQARTRLDGLKELYGP